MAKTFTATQQWHSDGLLMAFKKMGVKPNMGKSCIRFKELDKIPLDTIIGLIQNFPVEEYIKRYELVKKR